MKKFILGTSLLATLFLLTSCDGISPSKQSKEKTYDKELTSSTGKWQLSGDETTYFEFDGSEDKMTFRYVEEGIDKYSGIYRVVYRGNSKDVATTMTWILKRNDTEKEDWIYAYCDDFETNFTQFTTFREERDEGMNDGRIYSHIYRIGELPYRLGTYLLEGNDYKQEKENYSYAKTYQIPEGIYRLNEDVYFSFVMPKPYAFALFHYQKGDEMVEEVYWTAPDKKTIYLYIEHDPYEYIRKEDREHYDMTFSHDYPPDFYLRGNFDVSKGSILINDLYHHEYSPTTIQDSI